MNMSFKLGKVVIPVAEEVKIEVEGLEVSVSDYNLMEGLSVLKALPGVLRELKAVMEDEDMPSADKNEDEDGVELGFINHPILGKVPVAKAKHDKPYDSLKEETDEESFGLDGLLKYLEAQGKKVKVMKHPIFGPGLAVEKDGKNPLEELLKGVEGVKKSKHPLEGLLGGLFDKEI